MDSTHEELCALLYGVVRRSDRMPDSSFVCKDLVVISTFKRFVAKEVNLVIVIRRQELETIGLVPTGRKTIKGDLASNAVG